MELEIGMYVRTINGKIWVIKSQQAISGHRKDIINASYDIIDLIEVGDYVNGLKITLINEPSMANCNKRLLYAEDEEGYLIKMFDKKDIKSIVTREMFESMQYKVGE